MSKTFLISGEMTVTAFLEIKAEDKGQAIELARTARAEEWVVQPDRLPENLQAEESK